MLLVAIKTVLWRSHKAAKNPVKVHTCKTFTSQDVAMQHKLQDLAVNLVYKGTDESWTASKTSGHTLPRMTQRKQDLQLVENLPACDSAPLLKV